MVLSPALTDTAVVDLGQRAGVGAIVSPCFGRVHLELALVVTGNVESVLAGSGGLEPSLSDCTCSSVIVVSVLPGGEQLGLNNWRGLSPLVVCVWVCGVNDLGSETWGAWLSSSERCLRCFTSYACDFFHKDASDFANLSVNLDFDFGDVVTF